MEKYQDLLEEIIENSRQIFTSSLVGVYLHGSMAMGGFNPHKSDIDLIIVIQDEITDEQKLAFMKKVVLLNERAPYKGIEFSVVKEKHCNEFVYPTPFELHFSPMHLKWFDEKPQDYVEKMNGEDADLAAHFTIINHYGITLYGKARESVFSQVPRENYIDSIREDIASAKEEILDNPVYIILNLCRVLAYLKENLVLSKVDGGKWGLNNVDSKYHSLIEDALKCCSSDVEMNINKTMAVEFCDYMLKGIEKCQK